MSDPTDPSGIPPPSDAPRGEAPAWAPLAGLAGLLLMLLFTAWYIDTEPAPPWPDAAVDAGPDAAPDAAGGAGDGGAERRTP